LSRFLRFLESLREESDLGQPQVATGAEDVVRIMSVHRSKGLEFPVVIVPDLGKAINLQDCAGNILADRKAGLGMVVVDEEKRVRYPSLASVLVQNRLRQQALAEEMRILYVAMTRAKEHLVLIGTVKPEAPARWAARWARHEGPLPADVVLGARTVLDWVGPVAAATAPPRDEIFRVTAYAAEDVLAWHHPSRRAAPWTEAQQRMARLEPLDPPPPPHPLAEEVSRRLADSYAFRPYTAVAAAVSVTSAKQSASLRPPPLLPEARRPTGDEIGAATHRLLQHLDFERPCDAADIAAQVSELVDRLLLDTRSAGLVDAGAVAWLMSTEVGVLLRTYAKRLRRELPIYADVPAAVPGLPASRDPQDRVMLRGRLDVLVQTDDGCVIVDYKTDAVPPEQVDERVALYRPQVEAYAGAVARMTGRPVRTLVVFLKARVVVPLLP
jgi:ATP-dependent helicase/nuclease subunit A